MTNLDIIKYLATNNPTRLAEFLNGIYCHAWNAGVFFAQSYKNPFEENDIDDFNEWFGRDAATTGLYHDKELEEWSKDIGKTVCTATISKTIKDNKSAYAYDAAEHDSYGSSGFLGFTDTFNDAIDKTCELLQFLKNNKEVWPK